MFSALDPLLHSELRLGIISTLISVEEADFNYLKEATQSTSGNLSVQIDKLEKAEYITVEKSFVGKRTRTTCRITDKGLHAFEKYVEALKSYIEKKQG